MIKPVKAIGAARPDQDVVAACERLLHRAKTGELRSLVYAGATTGGSFITGHQTEDSIESAGLMHMALINLGLDTIGRTEDDDI